MTRLLRLFDPARKGSSSQLWRAGWASHSATAAFSLIEILVAVGLMSFIVLGLLLTFNQTQRVFKEGMSQADIMETGRAAIALVAADLEQVTPSHAAFTTNFSTEVSPLFSGPAAQQLTQGLPGSNLRRSNVIQKVFLLNQYNLNWIGIGYQVLPENGGGVGTLYRFTTNTTWAQAGALNAEFRNAPLSSLRRIADGIVHFRVVPFATNGFPVTLYGFRTNAYSLGYSTPVNVRRWADPYTPGEINTFFVSNAVPAYVELELGVLEPQILERFRSMAGNATAQRNYLSNHVAQVHIFRQRIPVRNVDSLAYAYP